ncbi:hypothetical protein ACS3SW_01655 [Roseobacteraceae bacterium S113]
MPIRLIAAVVAVGVTAGGASAWEGKTIACYDKVYMTPKYKVTKELVKPAKRQYEYWQGMYKLVEYPAVYKEVREELEPAHYVLKEIPCK